MQDSIVEPQAEDEELPQVDGLRILKTNGPEWLYILLGALASVIMGASMPVYAILFGEVKERVKINKFNFDDCFIIIRFPPEFLPVLGPLTQ